MNRIRPGTRARLAATVLLLTAALACGEPAGGGDAGTADLVLVPFDAGVADAAPGVDSRSGNDAAVGVDSRSGSDAAPGVDQRPASDSAVAVDSSTGTDSSTAFDAGTRSDAALPTRYPHDQLLSPLTATVASRLRAIRASQAGPQDDVFMKVGASGTVSSHLMVCFAGGSYTVDLDGRSDLQPSIDHFLGGDAAGSTPYQRQTLAAEIGKTAAWAISGDPSPLQQEVAAIQPRFALVNYGTNDMQMGTTHRSALYGFYTSMWPLLEQLVGQGIIPLVCGLNPRGDTVEAARWVPAYNAVTRGLAEAFQLPYLDLYLAVKDLPDQGLVSDGVHGNAYAPAGAQPCVFTSAGLAFNYNVRNLLTMEQLHQLRQVVLDGASAPDTEPGALQGRGSAADPFVIDALPFSHYADTRTAGAALIDGYPGCDSGQDESGNELHYRLDLAAATPMRLMVLDLGGADMDLHLLGASADPAGCVARDDKFIERSLASGSHRVVVDTYVPAGGSPRAGGYLFVALACESGDPDCP